MEITSQLNWYRGLINNEIRRSSAKGKLLTKIIIIDSSIDINAPFIEVKFNPSDHADYNSLNETILSSYEIGRNIIEYLFLANEITIKIEEIWK